MLKLRRPNLAERLLAHLVARIRGRTISFEQLILLARWLDSDPSVPDGKWFRRFDSFILCGEGEVIKTFLLAGQAPEGLEIQ
jgi:hypothetical protein